MKREHTENKYDVVTYFPLFNWRKCYFCNSEFRRETGYQWFVAQGYFRYSCGTCCASVSHCNDKIVHKRVIEAARIMGKLPPPPPMRTFRSR
jgi:hypothetical protein